MQEKILLDVTGSGSPLVDPLMQYGVSELHKTFDDAHRQEVFAIIDVIPSFANNQHDTENRFERLSSIKICHWLTTAHWRFVS